MSFPATVAVDEAVGTAVSSSGYCARVRVCLFVCVGVSACLGGGCAGMGTHLTACMSVYIVCVQRGGGYKDTVRQTFSPYEP